MATPEYQKRAKAKYDAKTARQFSIKLNKRTDPELIFRLENVGSVQTYIKKLIAEDIAKLYRVYWVGGEKDGQPVAYFDREADALHFAEKYSAEHEEEFDPVCGGLMVINPDGENIW